MAFQNLGLDVDIGPDGPQQIFMADKSTRIIYQEAKDIKTLRRQNDAIFSAGAIPSPQTHVDEVDPKCRRFLYIGHMRDFLFA